MKIRFYIAGIAMVTASSFAASAASVPHTFVAGEPINATEMNENFSDLKNQIINLEAKVDAIPAPVSGGGSGEVVFEGFSSGVAIPDVGLFGMNGLCAATYPNSRMCSSEEIWKATTIPILPIGSSAWVKPVIGWSPNGIAVDKISTVGGSDTTGVTLTCNSWGSNLTTRFGLSVNSDGVFKRSTCASITTNVACCSVN